jgi:4-alpha-glucanotransferase
MLSYRLIWLEDDPPSNYPERSMAAVTTHDLYTIAGFWTGSDFRSQSSIGLKPHPESFDVVVRRIQKHTGRAMIVAATVEDALLVVDRPNMPGTTTQWPNWRIALPATIEDLQTDPLPQQLAEILNRRVRTA